jgi:hypothetical protein
LLRLADTEEDRVLYQVIADHLETFLATIDADPTAKGLPAYVKKEFYAYLQCGILAHDFVRLGCDTCPHKMLLAFSCKRRGFCPSCSGRRMAQMAAHLVEQVLPWVPTRQWVVSVPISLRYWMASSKDLTAVVHTIIRRTISQYYVNQAVKLGMDRKKIQAGSITCVQRFGGSINLHVHYLELCQRRAYYRPAEIRYRFECRKLNYIRLINRLTICGTQYYGRNRQHRVTDRNKPAIAFPRSPGHLSAYQRSDAHLQPVHKDPHGRSAQGP